MMFFPSSSSAAAAAAAGAAVSSPADTGRKNLWSGQRSPSESRWRSGSQQRIYGRRLLEALRAARGGGGTPPQSLAGPRAIKDAADSALALTARGQTRWSRAILFGRCSRRKLLLKNGGKIRRRRPPRPGRKMVPPTTEPQPEALKGRKVRDRLRLLSRLVPGCRKLSAPSLLEEAADYVAALEMQVKTMRALADALSAAALSAPAAESVPMGGDGGPGGGVAES